MDKKTTITKHKIGKTTYLVSAAPSEKATVTIDKKVENLIMRDMQKSPATPGFSGVSSANK